MYPSSTTTCRYSQYHEKESAQLKQVQLDATNLTTLELIQLCNKYVSALAPKDEPVNTLKTKSEKKASGGVKGGKKR